MSPHVTLGDEIERVVRQLGAPRGCQRVDLSPEVVEIEPIEQDHHVAREPLLVEPGRARVRE
jgi:hypothetical protein